ncbi:hypothetical protein SDC9_200732 [bioreactor metagenome]|uniref:Uncharacterized protein n=1 Tax=bioreactor metagenome TaxID=1076179 RepID=A0A645IRS6_9ZZZZ
MVNRNAVLDFAAVADGHRVVDIDIFRHDTVVPNHSIFSNLDINPNLGALTELRLGRNRSGRVNE